MLLRNLRDAGAVERELPGHKMVEGRAETVNVTADIHRRAGQVFGADVLRSPHNLLFAVQGILFSGVAGKTEVGEFRFSGARKHDVVRLDVPVNQTLLLPCVIKHFGNLLDNLNGLVDGYHMVLLQNLLHGLPVDILHGEIVDSVILADCIRLHDMGMIQAGGGARLLDEADYKFGILRIIFRKDLESGGAVKRNLMRKINNAHSAAAELFFNDEVRNHRSGSRPGSRHRHNLLTLAALDFCSHFRIVHGEDFFAVRTLKTHGSTLLL